MYRNISYYTLRYLITPSTEGLTLIGSALNIDELQKAS